LLIGFVVLGAQTAPSVTSSCVGLSWPIDGQIVNPSAPTGRFSGHWGIDLAAEPPLATDETGDVRAAASGSVSFSGVVVGNQTITINHGGGLRTSYSYVTEPLVDRGAWLRRGEIIASTGVSEEHSSLHFSVRLDGVYTNPAPLLGCRATAPSNGLRLVPVP